MTFALPGSDSQESAENLFDTDETALQIYRHNKKYERLCD